MSSSSGIKTEKMLQSRMCNQNLPERNRTDPPNLDSNPWAKRIQHNVPRKTHKTKRKRKKCRVRDLNGKDSKLKSILTYFLQQSSIYALNRIGNSPTPAGKGFWIIILIIGVIGCVSQVGQYLVSYYKYPVVVDIETINTNRDGFPSVTICNMNAVRNKFLPCVKDKNMEGCPDQSSHTILNNSMENEQPFCGISSITSNTTFSEDYFYLSELLYSVNYKTRVKYGHQLKDFFVKCEFNGDYDCKEFQITNSYIYGNCFTFNADGSMSTRYVGPSSGLHLELNLEVDEYVNYTESLGVRVQIHESSLPHDIESKGVTLSPGFEHYIAITKSEISRLPTPYKDNCKNYDVGDSQKLCIINCTDKEIQTKCFCTISKNDLDDDIQKCDMKKALVFCCVYVVKNRTSCDCPLACHELEYTIKLSSASWPSKMLYEKKLDKINGSFDDFRNSHLRLKIYCDKLDYSKYNQNAAYQSSELFSLIGGQMGLWLGLSLIAIFECLESIIILCRRKNRQ